MEQTRADPLARLRRTAGKTVAVTLCVAFFSPWAAAAKASLSGEVQGADGKPLAGVEITLRVPGDPTPAVSGSTNKKGKFDLNLPAPGRYAVHMVGGGHAPFDAEITVGVGESRTLDVKLITLEAGTRNKAISSYNDGVKALEAKDTETAKQKFAEATTVDPGLIEPWPTLARLHVDDGEYAEAAKAAETYLRHDPGATDMMVIAYRSYRELGDREKLENLRQALARDPSLTPELAKHVYNEGATAYGAGDDDAAIAAFRSAIEIDPQLAAAHSGLTNSLYRVDRYDEGLDAVSAWLEAIPGDANAFRMRFLILAATGNNDEADVALLAFAEKEPTAAAELLLRRAELDFDVGDLEAARRGLVQALKLSPDLARAHYRLGLVYSSSDIDKAKEHLQRFIDLTPDDPDAGAARQLIAAL